MTKQVINDDFKEPEKKYSKPFLYHFSLGIYRQFGFNKLFLPWKKDLQVILRCPNSGFVYKCINFTLKKKTFFLSLL